MKTIPEIDASLGDTQRNLEFTIIDNYEHAIAQTLTDIKAEIIAARYELARYHGEPDKCLTCNGVGGGESGMANGTCKECGGTGVINESELQRLRRENRKLREQLVVLGAMSG